MLIGAAASQGGVSMVRLLIDGTTAKTLGGENHEVPSSYQSPFAGVAPMRFQGLTIGTHTVRVQIHTRAPAKVAYLRAVSVPQLEFLAIQVVEYLR